MTGCYPVSWHLGSDKILDSGEISGQMAIRAIRAVITIVTIYSKLVLYVPVFWAKDFTETCG